MMLNTPSGHLIGLQQCDSFFAHPAGIFHQLQFFDQFISFILPLPSVGIGIRPLLNFASGKGMRGIAGSGGVFRLMNVGAFGGKEPLLFPAEVQVGLGQRDALHGTQFRINLQQQLDILLDRGGEGIDLEWRSPLGGGRLFRGQLDVVLLHPRGSLGDFDRARSRGFDSAAAQIV